MEFPSQNLQNKTMFGIEKNNIMNLEHITLALSGSIDVIIDSRNNSKHSLTFEALKALGPGYLENFLLPQELVWPAGSSGKSLLLYVPC